MGLKLARWLDGRPVIRACHLLKLVWSGADIGSLGTEGLEPPMVFILVLYSIHFGFVFMVYRCNDIISPVYYITYKYKSNWKLNYKVGIAVIKSTKTSLVVNNGALH